MNAWIRRLAGVVGLSAVAVMLALGSTAGCRGSYAVTGTGSADDVLTTGRTLSFFNAVQVDPPSEDSAGPQFVTQADLNGDGLIDLVSAWNQSQPVQVHLQRRDAIGTISFETITLAGNIPAVSVAGLGVADFDGDARQDIAVLIKISLLEDAGCLDSELPPPGTLSGMVVLYLGPDDSDQTNQALAWEEVIVEASRLPAPADTPAMPELEGFTDMAIGDIDLDGSPDIVLASNAACDGTAADVLVISSDGPNAVVNNTWRIEALPDTMPKTTIKSVALADMDGDTDLDIVATFPDAPSMNIRWFRNPAIDIADDFHISDGLWQVGTVAQIATGADVIELAQINSGEDAFTDVVVRSSGGGLIQWLKGPAGPTTTPLRAIPWQVFTLTEFTDRTPEAIAVGDVSGDGLVDLIVAAEGGLAWFDGSGAPTRFDQWTENLIVDEAPPEDDNAVPLTTDPTVEPQEVRGGTFINSILVVDLDGDGMNDVVATMDRNGLSGLTNDALVWFRNTSR